MRVLIASPEAAPYSRRSRLADDVVGLATSLAWLGHDVTLISPMPDGTSGESPGALVPTGTVVSVPLGDRQARGAVFLMPLDQSGLRRLLVRFVQPEGEESRPGPLEQSVFLSRAVFEVARAEGLEPDVIHAYGCQTGLVPALLELEYRSYKDFARTASVFTIHDITEQGLHAREGMRVTGLDERHFNWRQMEFHGELNLLKTGIVFAGLVTAVSPAFAKEICTREMGCGLDGVLRERANDLVGILNGTDAREWNPADDPHLPQSFTIATWKEEKQRCKAELQRRVGLPQRHEVPLIGLISRFVDQKGFDLLMPALESILGDDVQVALIGSGEQRYEDLARFLAGANAGKMALIIGFDAGLAQLIEAGADVYLMVSRYEPSGVTSLNSMCYGTVAVVSATGGLANSTIHATDETLRDGTATGFLISDYSEDGVVSQVRRATDLYRKPDEWEQLVKAGLRRDSSWRPAAGEYSAVYERALRKLDAAHLAVTSPSARTVPFTVVESLSIPRGRDVARIELCVGDITSVDASDGVDVLVVSAFPNDYTPLPNTVMGALHDRGVSVRDLAQNPHADLRTHFSSWLSTQLDPSLPFRRVLCFEPLRLGAPPERVGDIFRALAPFVFDTPQVRSIAMPILASGYHRQSPTIMLEAMLDAATHSVSAGFPLTLLRVVAHPPDYLTESERVSYIDSLRSVMMKATARIGRELSVRGANDYKYDLFLSYSRLDQRLADHFLQSISEAYPGIRVFVDRKDLEVGSAWQRDIFEALDACWRMAALFSPSYIDSKVCIDELNIGLCRAREEERTIVFPLFLYSAQLPTYMKLAGYLDCREGNREKISEACRTIAREIRGNGQH